MPITNLEVLELRGALFSEGYQVPAVFANRTAEREELLALIEGAGDRRAVIVADSLGAGKSFLIQMVAGDLGHTSAGSWPTVRNLANLAATDAAFSVVEDFDIKMPYADLTGVLDTIARLWQNLPPTVLLVGDHTLRNPDLLRHLPGEIATVRMKPLDTEFFLHAVGLRVERFTGHKGEIELFDPEFLAYLLPNTSPPVATFRETFSILWRMAAHLPLNRAPCRFSGGEFAHLHPFSGIPPESPADRLAKWLLDYIRRVYKPGVPLAALETSMLLEAAGLDMAPESFEAAVLKPLVSARVLRSVGIPYSRSAGRNDRFPPPYLPSALAFLSARYGGGLA